MPAPSEPQLEGHKRLTGELRDALGLPYAPNRRSAEPVPVAGPAVVTDSNGATCRTPCGHRG